MARATDSTRFQASVDGGSKSLVPLTAFIKVVWEIPCYHVGAAWHKALPCASEHSSDVPRVVFAWGGPSQPRPPLYILPASTLTNSCTDAALLCSFAVSSSVSLIS